MAFASEFKLFRALTTSSGVRILLKEVFFLDKINTAGYSLVCFYRKDMGQQDRRFQKSLLGTLTGLARRFEAVWAKVA